MVGDLVGNRVYDLLDYLVGNLADLLPTGIAVIKISYFKLIG
jgi:hypothetical protein